MAFRSDASGDNIQVSGTWPSLPPITLCGWHKRSSDRNAYHSLITLRDDTGNSVCGVEYHDYSNSVTFYIAFSGSGFWYYERPFSTSVGDWVFVGLSWAGGTNIRPDLYWRLYSDTSLSTYNQGSGSTTSSFTPEYLMLNKWPGISDEWLDGVSAGIKLWNAALTADEMLRESYTLMPQRYADLICVIPGVGIDTKDLSAYGAGRSGSATGIAYEDGPPISYGGFPILLPQVSVFTGPTLSLPGVQNITATSVVPKVTLTW